MKRFCLTVAYDGTKYHGWQVQEGTPLTIEGVLNNALSGLLNEPIEVIGASRTDAGVHALGNLAVFDSNTTIPGERLLFAINPLLPDDIRVVDSREVDADFHPRHGEFRKRYEYRILNTPFPDPTRRLYSWHVDYKLDIDRMQEACDCLIGEHDFKAFCASGSQALTTVRTIYKADVTVKGDEIVFGIEGNGFLYNMVRIIAGTLVDIGRGRLEPACISAAIESGDRTKVGQTAPACGLVLIGYSLQKSN